MQLGECLVSGLPSCLRLDPAGSTCSKFCSCCAELSEYFSGAKELTRVKKDEKLQGWFKQLSDEICEPGFSAVALLSLGLDSAIIPQWRLNSSGSTKCDVDDPPIYAQDVCLLQLGW